MKRNMILLIWALSAIVACVTPLRAMTDLDLIRLYNALPSEDSSGVCRLVVCFSQYKLVKAGGQWSVAPDPSYAVSISPESKFNVTLDGANGYLKVVHDFRSGSVGHVEQELAVFSTPYGDYVVLSIRQTYVGTACWHWVYRYANSKLEKTSEDSSPIPRVTVLDFLKQPYPAEPYKILSYFGPRTINVVLPRKGTTVSICFDAEPSSHGIGRFLPAEQERIVKATLATVASSCIEFRWEKERFVESGRTPLKLDH